MDQTNTKQEGRIETDIADLQAEIKQFQNRQNKKNVKVFSQNKNFALVYNVFADLLSGVITAFILNKIYVYFFGKNTLIFALLLICCIMAGLYNTIKFFIKKTVFKEQHNQSMQR